MPNQEYKPEQKVRKKKSKSGQTEEESKKEDEEHKAKQAQKDKALDYITKAWDKNGWKDKIKQLKEQHDSTPRDLAQELVNFTVQESYRTSMEFHE